MQYRSFAFARGRSEKQNDVLCVDARACIDGAWMGVCFFRFGVCGTGYSPDRWVNGVGDGVV